MDPTGISAVSFHTRFFVGTPSRETTVSVQDAKGAPEGGDVGQRIVSLLVAELK